MLDQEKCWKLQNILLKQVSSFKKKIKMSKRTGNVNFAASIDRDDWEQFVNFSTSINQIDLLDFITVDGTIEPLTTLSN